MLNHVSKFKRGDHDKEDLLAEFRRNEHNGEDLYLLTKLSDTIYHDYVKNLYFGDDICCIIDYTNEATVYKLRF